MTVVVLPTPEKDFPVALRDDLIVAHRDARFLHMWLKTYHEYDDREVKHATSTVMRSLLKNNSEYVYKLANNMSVTSNDREHLSATLSKKNFFVVNRSGSAKCIF